MRDVFDFANFFIKNGADSMPNTYDGNMKLQKLLVFADLINIAEYGEPLFNEQVLAFENGCVVEKMREIILAYRETASDTAKYEIINGVTFYYDGFALTDDMIDRLESFSLSAEYDTYSVYVDNGRLVIY